MLRKLWPSLWLLLPLLCAAKDYRTEFDADIQSACDAYLQGVDCDWFKALIYTESRFDPDAVSPVGAMGLGQIMPGTWKENAAKIDAGDNPFDAKQSLRVGAFYLRRVIKFWDAYRPPHERVFLGLASYNAGPGNILKAQRQCGGARTWANIRPCLPQITGHHSKETINYVKHIQVTFCRIKKFKGGDNYFGSFIADTCIQWLSVPD